MAEGATRRNLGFGGNGRRRVLEGGIPISRLGKGNSWNRGMERLERRGRRFGGFVVGEKKKVGEVMFEGGKRRRNVLCVTGGLWTWNSDFLENEGGDGDTAEGEVGGVCGG